MTNDTQPRERWPITRTGTRAPIPRDTRRLIWHRDGGRCQHCGAGQVAVQLDHIIPWSSGGPDTSDNLRLLCGPCNEARSNFRSSDDDTPAIPITLACDNCIRRWVRLYGYTRYGTCVPGNPNIAAFCGTCMTFSHVTDPARLK